MREAARDAQTKNTHMHIQQRTSLYMKHLTGELFSSVFGPLFPLSSPCSLSLSPLPLTHSLSLSLLYSLSGKSVDLLPFSRTLPHPFSLPLPPASVSPLSAWPLETRPSSASVGMGTMRGLGIGIGPRRGVRGMLKGVGFGSGVASDSLYSGGKGKGNGAGVGCAGDFGSFGVGADVSEGKSCGVV